MSDTFTDHVNTLVSSHDVSGTSVHSPQMEKIGTIDHLMIDKRSGKVAYAIMNFGGFLGLGENEYVVPWGSLRYDKDVGGFMTEITAEDLEGAPPRREDWHRDRAYEQNLYDYYRVPYYWI